ncbi:unnamed protein product [Oikopleura dioica]|uniref:Uncharacterized protein n=1 Tax=Oikopleura dioica TaxID=34765 RepID=E4X6G5_OIKDI|nr:unnamed protein product [Oikopleura dioica]
MIVNGWTPLHEAASKKSAQIMTHLLMSGVDLDTTDCFGVTPLFTAVISGSHECAKLLLERGADVDNGRAGFSENPATPLHEAARRGDLKMCEILLEHGANPNALDKRNRAPIHLAAMGDFIAIVGELTRVTNKRRIYKESGLSPIISCLEDASDNYYTMELLLEDGWDPNHCINNDVQLRYKDGRKTALYFAVLNNNEDAVELLLQYGAKVNLDPLKCITVAVGISNFDIFDMLLLHGADIHEVNVNVGDFPTTFASALSDHRFITRLLQMGLDADYFFKCPFGEKEHPSYEDLVRARTQPIPWCVKMQNIKNTSMPSWLVPYIFKFSGRNNINKMKQKPAPLKHLTRNAFVKACRPKLQEQMLRD